MIAGAPRVDVSPTSSRAPFANESPPAPSANGLSVLHCLWSGSIGGAERAVFQLVREQLRDPDLEPALLFATGGGLFWEKAQSLGCPVVTLDLPHGHALRKVPAVVAAMRPFTVHHFHGAEPLLMFASARCPEACRVYTHRGGITRYSPSKRLKYELSGALLRRYFHGYSGNTAHGARSGAKLFRMPEQTFEVTYNGLDFGLLSPDRPAEAVRSSLGLTHSDLVVGTAANLKAWKRIDRLIAALTTLAAADVRLLIVETGRSASSLRLTPSGSGYLRESFLPAGRTKWLRTSRSWTSSASPRPRSSRLATLQSRPWHRAADSCLR